MTKKRSQSTNKLGWPDDSALVLSTSRRSVQILLKNTQTLVVPCRSQIESIVVGDHVSLIKRGQQLVVDGLLPRENLLERSYRGSPQAVAANLDRIIIVAATQALFQPLFIDRVLTVASKQKINCSLLVNKIDLGLESCQELIEVYRALGLEIYLCSAKYNQGLEVLKDLFEASDCAAIALVGLSGVGKSTIINQLLPQALTRTAAVSQKTGLGRQTTSQAKAYLVRHPTETLKPALLIDLPGIQQFGVEHLTAEEIQNSFKEFLDFEQGCEYGSCSHTLEQVCAVKEAVEQQKISSSRYSSYLHMLEELKTAGPVWGRKKVGGVVRRKRSEDPME